MSNCFFLSLYFVSYEAFINLVYIEYVQNLPTDSSIILYKRKLAYFKLILVSFFNCFFRSVFIFCEAFINFIHLEYIQNLHSIEGNSPA